jgi:flavin reductase (DIM6/NTAB) family NADH-FMN oxidoreductase RutF
MKKLLPPYVHSWPAPAILVGCGTVEKPNLITLSWFGVVCSEPPMISIGVRPLRYSYELIRQNGEFTVNLPRVQDLEAVKRCGKVSGRDVDKFKDVGLTPVACPPLEYAPMVQEFPVSIACRVVHELSVGTHHAFISEVLGVHGEEEPNLPAPRAYSHAAEQMVYVDGTYWSLSPVR